MMKTKTWLAKLDRHLLVEDLVDDQNSLATRCQRLERELAAAKSAEPSGQVVVSGSEELEKWMARCREAEKELRESNSALEILLDEKARRLDDQDHLVDRRLVTSTLALYHDHVSSGQHALAEQVLNTALHVLAVPEDTQRSQVKKALAAAEARMQRVGSEPLGNAFLDFLEKEAQRDEPRKPSDVAFGRVFFSPLPRMRSEGFLLLRWGSGVGCVRGASFRCLRPRAFVPVRERCPIGICSKRVSLDVPCGGFVWQAWGIVRAARQVTLMDFVALWDKSAACVRVDVLGGAKFWQAQGIR